LELSLGLTNAARLDIVRLLIENPSGMTEDELAGDLGRNQPQSRAHLRSELQIVSLARALPLNAEIVKLMESATENEYRMYYRR
jgi:predicted transcriptional regulator